MGPQGPGHERHGRDLARCRGGRDFRVPTLRGRDRSPGTRPYGGRRQGDRRGALVRVLVLCIETSTPQASIAIGSEQGVVASITVARGASYNEFLLPAIHFGLEQTGLGFRNLGGVAVGLGPGLFTGMRIGVATAKA